MPSPAEMMHEFHPMDAGIAPARSCWSSTSPASGGMLSGSRIRAGEQPLGQQRETSTWGTAMCVWGSIRPVSTAPSMNGTAHR